MQMSSFSNQKIMQLSIRHDALYIAISNFSQKKMKRSRNNNLKNQEKQGSTFDAFSVIFKTVLITFGFLWLLELKNSAQSSLRAQKRQLQDFLPFSSIFVEEIDVKKIISKPEEISQSEQNKNEKNANDSQKIVNMVQKWSPTSSTQIITQTVRNESRNMTTKNIDNNMIDRVSKYMKISTDHLHTLRTSCYRPRKPKKRHTDRFHSVAT